MCQHSFGWDSWINGWMFQTEQRAELQCAFIVAAQTRLWNAILHFSFNAQYTISLLKKFANVSSSSEVATKWGSQSEHYEMTDKRIHIFLYVSQNEGSIHTFLLYFREFFSGAPILIIKMIQHYIRFRNSTTPFPNVLFETEFEWAFPVNSMEFQPKFTQNQKNANYFFTDYYYQNYKRSTGMKFWRMLHLKMSHCVGV